jgi:hypothetical protein
MRRMIKAAVGAALVGGIAFGSVACDAAPQTTPSRKAEDKARNSNYDRLVKSQPAHSGSYSPTRDTKNFWIDTWMHDKDKLSYVYIQNANGEYGYFVLKGLPVTYCVSLTPPTQDHRINLGGDGSTGVLQQGPSVDGTFSSNSNCSSYYGKDATTGAYVEFSVGQNQSYFLYDQPIDLPQFEKAQPMGPTTIAAAKKIDH